MKRNFENNRILVNFLKIVKKYLQKNIKLELFKIMKYEKINFNFIN